MIAIIVIILLILAVVSIGFIFRDQLGSGGLPPGYHIATAYHEFSDRVVLELSYQGKPQGQTTVRSYESIRAARKAWSLHSIDKEGIQDA